MPAGDGGRIHGAVEQQHPDEGPGAVLVAELLPGPVPEALVDRGEGAGLPGSDQRAGPGQGPGLDAEDLQVVVEVEYLGPFAERPGVPGDDARPVHGQNGVGPEAHVDPAAGVADRDGVEGLADTHPGLGVDPAGEVELHLEGLVRQGQQLRLLGREVLGHSEAPGLDVAEVVPLVASGHQLVQHLHGGDVGDRDEVAPAEPPDLAFHATLLVGALDAGQTEEGLEAVVAAHGDESVGLDPTSALHHPDDGGLQVVVADALGHPAEVGEGGHVSIEEHLLGLVHVDPVEPLAAGRQSHHEHPALDRLPVEEEADLAEVDLGLLAERMVLGHAHIGQGQ